MQAYYLYILSIALLAAIRPVSKLTLKKLLRHCNTYRCTDVYVIYTHVLTLFCNSVSNKMDDTLATDKSTAADHCIVRQSTE